ncbi:hypothetical protein pqer_cds_941 [Pandoravirus quercus]|uniref:Uncharacterized protein n=1 Tax=Pandoravirus quercus TaxID=2107709 RepID=A0A2U7UA89_9VIRU|nr:hypothetical protein pqer_cds_941 [Pandoravirus quercus]AVK75363.1 hypothetical protein pqer_cds_941 [Pandoravirus quercus]
MSAFLHGESGPGMDQTHCAAGCTALARDKQTHSRDSDKHIIKDEASRGKGCAPINNTIDRHKAPTFVIDGVEISVANGVLDLERMAQVWGQDTLDHWHLMYADN